MSLRYETLADLKAAYDKGEILPEHAVTLDNDDTFLYVPESRAPEPRQEDGEWTQVFDGGTPQELLEAALDLLGIPYQGA